MFSTKAVNVPVPRTAPLVVELDAGAWPPALALSNQVLHSAMATTADHVNRDMNFLLDGARGECNCGSATT